MCLTAITRLYEYNYLRAIISDSLEAALWFAKTFSESWQILSNIEGIMLRHVIYFIPRSEVTFFRQQYI